MGLPALKGVLGTVRLMAWTTSVRMVRNVKTRTAL